ncbi:glutathione S-transferase T3-like [Brassica napus]|uniref:glutathione S-transferase T3-like n=1 Tax=Brassica napus TaxID=3708 RepID=UPI002078946A|nr:glutathione S-transferase T3-like [Brassica napus]
MNNSSGFRNLLYSQCPIDLDSPERVWFGSQPPEPVGFGSQAPVGESGEAVVESAIKERRKWSPQEDLILIGAWLNTSKDAVKNTEQKAGAFWKRIIDYYNASPLLVGTIPRELTPAKQRWARINADVSKFVGCYDQAMREQKSGENDDDLMKAALDYYFKDQGHKFGMEHAWRELRRDQKWCSSCKDSGKDKRKHVLEVDIDEDEGRPVGVKAAKAASKKKKSGKEEELSRLQTIMEIKQKLSNQKLLDRLLAKKVPLTEMETSLKLKLMSDML